MATTTSTRAPGSLIILCLAWLAVGVPLLWGIGQTIKKALPLFS